METRCPGGAGQRQRSWLGAKHDSPGSRQGSRPASAKSVREYQQQNEMEREQEWEQEQEQKTSSCQTAGEKFSRQTAQPERP
ncbi:hypothetical protein BSB13_22815 [Salmonella enterica]|uniref:Uncharacterized protein n=1 Tax=Salmonella enterica subsp. enterica serovar Saintpaul TaxID=90105 RepID=A0A5W5JYN8_SALET|nr:hypothetical protein [Salmonella enterica]EBK6648615.1 hypothetical protein [Salmonella enterica]EBX1945315.1 hypothetical protein [Salmonella enterica subsp. enterica serovar Saintpaul]EBY0515094.1 hypothetical protein [Salmonella enterica subsp. enterica serovar Saintpaul]ECT0092336.1 hypothetical protein [Salmonella enterica subsp. enterica serovar Saintpaul]